MKRDGESVVRNWNRNILQCSHGSVPARFWFAASLDIGLTRSKLACPAEALTLPSGLKRIIFTDVVAVMGPAAAARDKRHTCMMGLAQA